MSAPYEPTSHEAFSHDSIDSLAYDWERVASPNIAPKRPFQVFFPETTAEVVEAVKSLAARGKSFKIRSKGHSSNDLVLEDRGNIICMEHMRAIKGFSADDGTVTVHSGAVLADVDDFLAKRGWGLPIIGDHNHITAGGFASVGGISPASHRHGMFLDNVVELEYVTREGEVRRISAAHDRDEFYAVLGSTGQLGVITELVLRVIRIDKYGTILHNTRTLTLDVDDYVKRTAEFILHPGDDVIMERGVWLNLPVAGREMNVGQFSAYSATSQSPVAKLGDRFAYGYLHGLGNIAGRLPGAVDEAVKYLGMAGIILSPKYATIKNIERFTDKVLDSSVGDPTRMFIILGPAAHYETLFRELYSICRRYRSETGCFTFISIYVKAIHSQYLSQRGSLEPFCELMLYAGLDPKAMTSGVLDKVVSEIDDLTISQGAFRYMHSRTVKDPERRRRIDPNTYYADRFARSRSSSALRSAE
jgi:hypothetical protein